MVKRARCFTSKEQERQEFLPTSMKSTFLFFSLRIDDVNDSVYTETNRKLNDSVMDRIIMTAKNLFVKKDNRQS